MGLSRTVSEINGDFGQKSQNFPTPVCFAPPPKGFPFELGTGAVKKNYDGVIGPRKKFDNIFSRVDTIHQSDRRTDRRTDGQTDTGWQQRPRLRIATRGKQEVQLMLTTGAMRLAVSRGQQTWYHFGPVATFRYACDRHHAS